MKTLILSLALLGAASAAQGALTPDEQSFSQSLAPSARAKYTATREYVHRAEAIINNGVDPLSLGRKPANIDTQYYKGDEASTVSQARDLSNIALMNGIKVV